MGFRGSRVQIPPSRLSEDQALQRLSLWGFFFGCAPCCEFCCESSPPGPLSVPERGITRPKSRQAFVAMWFDKEMDEAYEKGLKAGIEKSGHYSAVRMLSVEHNDRIDGRIVAEIRSSGLVVADLTGDRGRVYFEAGYAKGLGIAVIWCCRKDWFDKVHFDANHYNFIIWETPDELVERVHNRIIASAILPQVV